MISRGRFEAKDRHIVTVPLQRTATPPPAFSSPIPPASGFENNEEEIEDHHHHLQHLTDQHLPHPDPVEEWQRQASEDQQQVTVVRRPSSAGGGSNRSHRGGGGGLPPRKSSSSGSFTSASAVATTKRGHPHQRSSALEVTGGGSTGSSTAAASKKGYSCCSKREKSSALAALIGCVSLASLMTGLVADLWVNTDEWIPSVTKTNQAAGPATAAGGSGDSGLVDPSQPQVQPRHGEVGDQDHHNHHRQGSAQRIHFAVGLWTVCPSYQDGRTNLKGKSKKFVRKSL